MSNDPGKAVCQRHAALHRDVAARAAPIRAAAMGGLSWDSRVVSSQAPVLLARLGPSGMRRVSICYQIL